MQSHGPFAWGNSAADSVSHIAVLEETAAMATYTRLLNPTGADIQQELLDKHFLRKHGPGAYYGQK